MLFVIPGTQRGFGQMTTGVPLFTLGDLDAIRHQAHDVALVTAAGSRVERIVYGGRNRSSAVGGVMPEYFEIRELGRDVGAPATRRRTSARAASVCLVGQTIVDDLFLSQSPARQGPARPRQDVPGHRRARVEGRRGRRRPGRRRVHAVLDASRGASSAATASAAIMASAVSTDRIDEAKEEMTQILRRRRHIAPGDDDNFSVRDPRDIQAVLQSVMGMLTTLLAGVAAVSLVVGGIGIMNIMLVSVTERTREIGVRLAIGARARDILTQFLVEATTLSAVGGGVGIVLGLVGAWGVARRSARAVRHPRHLDAGGLRGQRVRGHRLRRVARPQGRAAAPARGAALRVAPGVTTS